MTSTMTSEIYWLTLNVVYSALLFIPYAYDRITRIGWQVFINPLPGDDPFDKAWAHRAYRAHMNAFENLVVFAPLALAVHITGSSNEVTALACATYFWVRLVHAPFYILKTPFVRLLSYAIGLSACFVLAYQLLV